LAGTQPHRARGRALAALCLAGLCGLALSACASTTQDKPIPHNVLENMIEANFPVYWLGRAFEGMQLAEAIHDPSDAWSVQYGNCLEGGEGGCVPRLRIVTSPDNSFLPGGQAFTHDTRVRGVRALLAQGGKTIALATGTVVIDIYATNPRTAVEAARTAVPINATAQPQAPLPAALPNTGFDEQPLSSQIPSPLRPLG
jgi:hypothetical protein